MGEAGPAEKDRLAVSVHLGARLAADGSGADGGPLRGGDLFQSNGKL